MEEQLESGEPLGEMGFMDHLAELRNRLLYSIIAVGITTCAAFFYVQPLVVILIRPFHEAFAGKNLIGTSPEGAFLLKMQVAVCAGLVIALPIVLYQFWQFLAPGLYEHERRLALPFILISTILFLVGLLFAYEIVVPFTMSFFHEQYESLAQVESFVEVSRYISLLLKILLGFGLVFETPVLAYFLARVGLITSRMLIDGFRYAVVGIFIVSAVLTPPDVLTQFLMAGPLLLLYGISIIVVHLAQRSPEQEKSTP